jgi:hypothetical protein
VERNAAIIKEKNPRTIQEKKKKVQTHDSICRNKEKLTNIDFDLPHKEDLSKDTRYITCILMKN